MNTDIMPYYSTDGMNRQDRTLARNMRPIHDSARLANYRVDGMAAVTMNAMRRTAELDQERQSLAGNNKVLNEMLLGLEVEYVRDAAAVRNRMYGSW